MYPSKRRDYNEEKIHLAIWLETFCYEFSSEFSISMILLFTLMETSTQKMIILTNCYFILVKLRYFTNKKRLILKTCLCIPSNRKKHTHTPGHTNNWLILKEENDKIMDISKTMCPNHLVVLTWKQMNNISE